MINVKKGNLEICFQANNEVAKKNRILCGSDVNGSMCNDIVFVNQICDDNKKKYRILWQEENKRERRVHYLSHTLLTLFSPMLHNNDSFYCVGEISE